MFTFKVTCGIISNMNIKNELKSIGNQRILTPSMRSTLKLFLEIPDNIKIPDKVLIETVKRRSSGNTVEEIPDRIEKNDLNDLKDILGIDIEEIEDLFKI